MNHRTLIFWLSGWTAALSASAQATDTLRLPEIRVTDAALSTRHVQAFSAHAADADAGIARVLARSSVTVRAYAPGILETVSFRGFSASQTQVLWNGFPLNHAMVGLTDLSLYPAFLFDGMVVDKAGGSSDHALSAMGGTVELRSGGTSGHAALLTAGAFGQRGFGFRSGTTVGGTRIRVGVIRHQTANDFPYRDVFAVPVSDRRRVNADREQASAMAHIRRITSGYRADHHVFATHRESGIPGPISAPTADAAQTDRILRYHGRAAWRFGPGWGTLAIQALGQDLDYIATGVNSLSSVRALGFRAGFGTADARVFLERSQTWVDFSEYAAPGRVLWTTQADVRRGRVSASVRTDHDSAYGWFWSASAGVRQGGWSAHMSRTVGIPTFNDLYWPMLGNPDLTPESAWKAEVAWSRSAGNWHVAVPAHAAVVEDGIQWIPGGDGQFRPRNIRRMRTFGIEPEIRYRESRVHAAFTDARVIRSRFPGDRALDRQVPYIPKWTAGGEHTFRWRRLYVRPEVRYTGLRSTTEDGQFPIGPQWEADATTGAAWTFGRFGFDASATVRNLTDTDLSTIRWYPMPGRHLVFTLHLTMP